MMLVLLSILHALISVVLAGVTVARKTVKRLKRTKYGRIALISLAGMSAILFLAVLCFFVDDDFFLTALLLGDEYGDSSRYTGLSSHDGYSWGYGDNGYSGGYEDGTTTSSEVRVGTEVGHATGEWAITLADGTSWYWYHQYHWNHPDCKHDPTDSKYGPMTQLRFGVCNSQKYDSSDGMRTLGGGGCSVYSTCMALSNAIGRPILAVEFVTKVLQFDITNDQYGKPNINVNGEDNGRGIYNGTDNMYINFQALSESIEEAYGAEGVKTQIVSKGDQAGVNAVLAKGGLLVFSKPYGHMAWSDYDHFMTIRSVDLKGAGDEDDTYYVLDSCDDHFETTPDSCHMSIGLTFAEFNPWVNDAQGALLGIWCEGDKKYTVEVPTSPDGLPEGLKNLKVDYSSLTKEPGEYYTAEQCKTICYNFFRQEVGLNHAATCGIVANIEAETSFIYDQLEVSGGGYAFLSGYGEYETASDYGNGNYRNLPDRTFEILPHVIDAPNVESRSTIGRYGAGWGILGFSWAWRDDVTKYCKDNGFGTPLVKGGDGSNSLFGQLLYIKDYIFVGNSAWGQKGPNILEYLKNIPDTEQGAYDAGYQWEDKIEGSLGGPEARANNARAMFSSYKPSLLPTRSSALTKPTQSTSSSDMSSIFFIGDSNMYQTYAMSGSPLKEAKGVAAIGSMAASSGATGWDTFTGSSATGTTCGGKTVKSYLASVNREDLSKVVICLGTNDLGSSSDAFKAGLTGLCEYIRSLNPESSINLCTIPGINETQAHSPPFNYPAVDSMANVQARNLDVQAVVSEVSKCHLIDVYSLSMSYVDNDMQDGIHFNDKAHKAMVEYMAQNAK